MALIEFTRTGLYCPQGDFYIDPWRAVKKAVITHGHSDHARRGHKAYFCHHRSKAILEHRLGKIKVRTAEYGEVFSVNGVKISLFPAGHIIGSAQVKVEYRGEIWVISGDYKLTDDGISTPFEPVSCHHFVTESTFGLPVFRFPVQEDIFRDIRQWWAANREKGIASVLIGYSLGKAQRLLVNLNQTAGEIFLHGAIYQVHEIFINNGIPLPYAGKVTDDISKERLQQALIIAPPSATGTPWINRFRPCSIGIASGWMNIRGMRRRSAVDRGFALSDHCDWDQLNTAVAATGAENIYVTHGYTSPYTEWLISNGYNAVVVSTEYQGEPQEGTSPAREGGEE